MITRALNMGEFHPGMTKQLIGLNLKKGNLKVLNYWRPITLHIVRYNIYANAMQLKLQPLLMEVI